MVRYVANQVSSGCTRMADWGIIVTVLGCSGCRLSPVAQVDPSDDEIERFVVQRYAYDPARNERRHMVTAAFDNSREYEAAIEAGTNDLQRRRKSGEDIDPREHISGTVREPGYHRKQRAGRLIQHAIERGARLDEKTWHRLTNDLPPNITIMRFKADQDT